MPAAEQFSKKTYFRAERLLGSRDQRFRYSILLQYTLHNSWYLSFGQYYNRRYIKERTRGKVLHYFLMKTGAIGLH